jgi:hypothetical protein
MHLTRSGYFDEPCADLHAPREWTNTSAVAPINPTHSSAGAALQETLHVAGAARHSGVRARERTRRQLDRALSQIARAKAQREALTSGNEAPVDEEGQQGVHVSIGPKPTHSSTRGLPRQYLRRGSQGRRKCAAGPRPVSLPLTTFAFPASSPSPRAQLHEYLDSRVETFSRECTDYHAPHSVEHHTGAGAAASYSAAGLSVPGISQPPLAAQGVDE